MLVLILLWLLLTVVTFTIGLGLLQMLRADCLHRQGDRLILALWLGLFTLAWALFTVSLVLPLSPWVGLVVAGGLMAIALAQRNTAQESRALLKTVVQMPWSWKITGLGLTLATAFFSAQGIIWFDTGLYHYQAIEWLRLHGTVPGLALLHGRFGTNSSWFALAAPLNVGIFREKITACLGGLTFLLGLCQSAIIFHRMLNKTEQFVDWFLGLSLFLVIPTLFWSSLPFSTSPDQPIIFVIILVAWLILLIASKQNPPQDQAKLIPLILTAIATTIKLSALPLVVLALVFYAFESQPNTTTDYSPFNNHTKQSRNPALGEEFRLKVRLQRLLNKLYQGKDILKTINISTLYKPFLQGAAFSLLLLLPFLTFNILTSGCMLFPASIFCFDLPWSMDLVNVENFFRVTQEWNQWIGAEPTGKFLGWVGPWIQSERQFSFLILSSMISLTLFLIHRSQISIPGRYYIITMATLGLIYVLKSAPTWRFGLGYACLLPAFVLAGYCHKNSRNWPWAALIIAGTANAWLEFSSPSFLLVSALTFLTIIGVYFYHKITSKQFYLILIFLSFVVISRHYILTYEHNRIDVKIYPIFAPSLSKTYPSHDFKTQQINDVTYFVPIDGTQLCWAAPLPCTDDDLIDDHVQLRDPDRGIGAGFINQPRSAN